MLTSNLTAEHQKALQEIMVTAEQKKHQRRSKEIEKAGGKNLFDCESVWVKYSIAYLISLYD